MTKLVRRNVAVIRWWILLYLSVNITAIYRHVVMSFTRMCVKVATAVTKINRLGIALLKPYFCEGNDILRKAKNTICWSWKVSFDTVWTTLFDWHLSLMASMKTQNQLLRLSFLNGLCIQFLSDSFFWPFFLYSYFL